ncbi:DUF1796 family putative cysteine peptidase [Candidatus Protochlamydia phocaeensis]|uniref:DUF1796 family putative cysteine peptidase n=1 Tax=Candidatus Protochlamydia phocaeensis TaxID=1414722 RepID=UPI000837E891|nr:DUF1796 family putative cysteine peptidase [Candidatus Protochlamydia phocaeensis]
MIKKLCVYLFLLVITPFAARAEIQAYDEIVSLGYGCQVAWQLETNGLRKAAYPFDWFHTSFDSLMAFIQHKGEHFLEWNHIWIVEPYPGDTGRFHVVDLLYGIHSYHDFLSMPPMANYNDIKTKYDRRINRFFELLNSNKKILFVREGFTREQVEQLDLLFQTLYPTLSYTILAVSDDEAFYEDWGLERIRNFYIQQKAWNWMGDFARWKEILDQFCIKHDVSERNPEDVW